MDNCPICGEDLAKSVYIRDNRYKSCPNCSKKHGVHAYFLTDSFGIRHHEDGTVFIQSWCPVCRSGKAGNPILFCR